MEEPVAESASPVSEAKSAGRSPGRRPMIEGNADDTRREIRHHALILFNERGYAAVSIDDIAHAAGVTRATLYYHYKGKADIFLQSVLITAEIVSGIVAQVVGRKDLSVRERLMLYARERRAGVKDEAHKTPGETVSEKMVLEAMPHLSPEQCGQIEAAFGWIHHLTGELMKEGIERGEFRPLPTGMLDYIFWQLFSPADYPETAGISREEFEEILLEVFFQGVAMRQE